MLLLPALACAVLLGGSDPFVRSSLPGGAELCVLEAPAAPGAAVFVMLPCGLLHDRPAHAQEAHLLEHFLIRGVDPGGFEVDTLRINGETDGATLRLEVLAPAERWRDALARPARWLATRELDEPQLVLERQRIAAEEQSTTSGGFTHKWALAAWSQVIAGGAARAAVHADAQQESAADLGARAAQVARLGRGARIVVAGPLHAAEVRELVLQEYARAFATGQPEASPAAVAPRARASVKAGWDLAAEHELEWTELPLRDAGDRAAALLLEQQALATLLQRSGKLLRPGQASASLKTLPGVGTVLLFSAGGFAPAQHEPVQQLFAAVRSELAGLQGEASWKQAMAAARMRLGPAPDFQAQRRQLARNPMATWIEGQYALDLATLEIAGGARIPELVDGLDAGCAARAVRLARALIEPGHTGSLHLAP